MKKLICYKCKKSKDILDYQYLYFKREYSRICKECEPIIKPPEPNKMSTRDPGEDLDNLSNDLVRDERASSS